MKEIDWSKAPEGWKLVPIKPTPEMRSAAGAAECMAVRERRQFFAGDSWLPMVRNAPEYSAPEWTGEGLPPVGTVCEWLQGSQHQWERIEILAYHGGDTWIQQEGKPSIIVGNIANLRPLRTPEAIAAEERSKAISQIIHAIGWSFSMPGAADAAARIYDAGWRLVTP